ncbi:TPA: hypothetical protein SAP37_001033 [Burkholderia multivorans]|nr:hypothetical protein [Burkholderia multivorans]HEF4823295.1 hypothetical protein [Burkholderia multivorans]
MTLPTGQISMSQIAAELGISATGLNLNHGWVRALAGKPSGTIGFSDLRGKTGRFDGNLAPRNGGTNPPTEAVDVNAPFFGATIVTVASAIGGGCRLTFSGTPTWGGNIRVTNNSLGQSAVFSPDSPNSWGTSTGGGFLGDVGSTYSFTLLPST